MSNDLVVRGSKHEMKLDHLVGYGSTFAIGGFGTSIASKAVSIFAKNKSIPQNLLKSASSYGIFVGIAGLAAIGSAYFLWNSITDDDITKQKASLDNNQKDKETPLLNFVQARKLSWLKTKKDIQQSIYSLLGWRE